MDWITLIGTLGGLELIKWVANFFVNRKTNARKEDAAADSLENENYRKQVNWLEERLSHRDAKIDALYMELRGEQSEKMNLIHKLHQEELKNKDMETKKCLIRGCTRREPPSEY